MSQIRKATIKTPNLKKKKLNIASALKYLCSVKNQIEEKVNL